MNSHPAILFLIVATALGFVLTNAFGHYVYAVGGFVASARRWASTARMWRVLPSTFSCPCAGRSASSHRRDATAHARRRSDTDYQPSPPVIVGGAPLGRRPRPHDRHDRWRVPPRGGRKWPQSLRRLAFWQPVATGLILIAAVAFDGYSKWGGSAPSEENGPFVNHGDALKHRFVVWPTDRGCARG